MTVRVEHLVTSGTFNLDGQTFDVDNNVWLGHEAPSYDEWVRRGARRQAVLNWCRLEPTPPREVPPSALM